MLLNACLNLEKGIGNDGLLGTITNYKSYLFDEYIDFALRKTPNLIYDIQFISTLRMMYLFFNVIWQITLILTEKNIEWTFERF